MDEKYKGRKWDKLTKFIDETWMNYDLTDTDFDNTFFKDTSFSNCNFIKSKLDQMGLFNASFMSCLFEKVSFKNVAVGAKGGLFEKTKFLRCDFAGKQFNYPHFKDCIFENCKLKTIDFNDSSFENCKFIGKLDDVSFNGIYHEIKTRHKILDQVDFSEAEFGEFVTFYDCDFSTCIPPCGKTFDELLYQIYSNDPTVLSTGSRDRIVLTRK